MSQVTHTVKKFKKYLTFSIATTTLFLGTWLGVSDVRSARSELLPLFYGRAEASDGKELLAGTQADVVYWNTCKHVTNSAPNSVYIPVATAAEWSSFYTNPPAGVVTGPCTGGVTTGDSAGDNGCGDSGGDACGV